jgi:hypothetical protein
MTHQRTRGLVPTTFLTAAIALAALSPLARGQDDDGIMEPPGSKISFAGGVDFLTAYYFRGYLQEDDGLITQPWAELGFSFVDNDQMTLSGVVGTWNSIHSEETGAMPGSTTESFYESDFYAGLELGVGDFTIGANYTLYMYPNDSAGDIQEVAFSVGYDDSALWGGDFALNPYILFAFEIDNDNGTGDEFAYWEVGIAPEFALDNGWTIGVPVAVGLSLDDYYVDATGDEELFGYFSFGAELGIPLEFMGDDYGAWSLGLGVYGLVLNEDAGLSDDEFEVVGKVGVAVEF